jgi:hypothetical protein
MRAFLIPLCVGLVLPTVGSVVPRSVSAQKLQYESAVELARKGHYLRAAELFEQGYHECVRRVRGHSSSLVWQTPARDVSISGSDEAYLAARRMAVQAGDSRRPPFSPPTWRPLFTQNAYDDASSQSGGSGALPSGHKRRASILTMGADPGRAGRTKHSLYREAIRKPGCKRSGRTRSGDGPPGSRSHRSASLLRAGGAGVPPAAAGGDAVAISLPKPGAAQPGGGDGERTSDSGGPCDQRSAVRSNPPWSYITRARIRVAQAG